MDVVNLRGRGLTSLPPEIGKLHNLGALCLSNNFLEIIPDTINNLKQLDSFDVYNNKLTF